MSRGESIRFVVLRSLGNFLVLFSLYGLIMAFGPVIYFELQYRISQVRGIHFYIEEPRLSTKVVPDPLPYYSNELGFASIIASDKQQVLTVKDPHFSILIPKIGASAKVFPNVDPNNPDEFLPILQEGVAHAKGSVFPGMPGNVYLFAHSTDNWWNVGRYNAVFYLLKDLSIGDDIVIFFENQRYDYIVAQTLVKDSSDVSFMTADHMGEQYLILQTCWPPGMTWKRFYVVAVPKYARKTNRLR